MPAEMILDGTVVIVGHYGSGKTEVAINLAADQQARGRRVRLADLDLINPYFRTREARQTLTDLGIDMVLPPDELLQADLPILAPQVAGLIRQPGDLAIIDAGGDEVGATVLAALAEAFRDAQGQVQMLQVVNPFRPHSGTVEKCLAMRTAIETAARMKVTGWIGNPHMMEESAPEHIHQGYGLMQSLAAASDLPLAFMTVPQPLLAQVDWDELACPLLSIRRQLVFPWQTPMALEIGS